MYLSDTTLARLARVDPKLLPIRHRSEQGQLHLMQIRVRAELVETRTRNRADCREHYPETKLLESAAAMISTSYTGSLPCNLLASANTSAGPTTSSIRAAGTAMIATCLTFGRAIFVWLPPRLFRCLAGRFAK